MRRIKTYFCSTCLSFLFNVFSSFRSIICRVSCIDKYTPYKDKQYVSFIVKFSFISRSSVLIPPSLMYLQERIWSERLLYNAIWTFFRNIVARTSEWVRDCSLTPIQQFFLAISWREQVNLQWDDDEVRFVLDQHAELDFCSASSLKQQSTGRHVAPLWHIILISTQPVCVLFSLMLRA